MQNSELRNVENFFFKKNRPHFEADFSSLRFYVMERDRVVTTVSRPVKNGSAVG